MIKQTLYLIALLIILAVVGSLGAAIFENLKKLPAEAPLAASSPSPVALPSITVPSFLSASGTISASPKSALNDIAITNPGPNAVVKSPLTISGSAVGNWYFEASFPVVITDGEGLILGEAAARALGDWMTTSSVPFTATLDFSAPKTPNGFLIFKNDNPSGNPALQRSIEIPVRFR